MEPFENVVRVNGGRRGGGRSEIQDASSPLGIEIVIGIESVGVWNFSKAVDVYCMWTLSDL